MALYVNYNEPIGIVKYHFKDKNKIDRCCYLPIYTCNGLFAIVHNKATLIMFACDINHFKRCLKDNLYNEFSSWTLSAEHSQSRGMMLQLIKYNNVVKYANDNVIKQKLILYHID